MNTTEVIASVRSSTNRPDKDDLALEAINEAISVSTMQCEFARDLVEDQLTLDPTLYGQVVSLSDLERFRKLKYLRPTNRRKFLKLSDPVDLYSPTGVIQPDRFVIAGLNVTLVLSVLSPTLEIGYYTYAPILTEVEGANTHWMLDILPFMVINFAKARVFSDIGDDASAKIFMGRYEDQYAIARRDLRDSSVAFAS